MLTSRITGSVLGTAIEVTDFDHTCETVLALVRLGKPAYVCFATAHMLVEATRDPGVKAAYRNATIIAPDGAPVAWCLRLKGHPRAMCVSGPRTMPLLLQAASMNQLRVGLYGGRPETLALLQEKLRTKIPELQIVWSYSPPFRPLTAAEQEHALQQVAAAGVQLLFIGLGSPKQERWMQEFSPSLNCVCLGVGAAFEFLSGEKVLPPVWVQRMGLTWLIRLCQEPRRLARRNLCSFIFAGRVLQELAAYRFSSRWSPHTVTPSSRINSATVPPADDDTAGLAIGRQSAPPWSPLGANIDSLAVHGEARIVANMQDLKLGPTPSIHI